MLKIHFMLNEWLWLPRITKGGGGAYWSWHFSIGFLRLSASSVHFACFELVATEWCSKEKLDEFWPHYRNRCDEWDGKPTERV